jgi:hypothetical protein
VQGKGGVLTGGVGGWVGEGLRQGSRVKVGMPWWGGGSVGGVGGWPGVGNWIVREWREAREGLAAF